MAQPLGGYVVTLPGADDVFNLIPDAALDPIYLQQRAAERAQRLRESPVPEIAQNVVDVLQKIDDVQDALVTLSLITRFAVPQVAALAPFAKAIATAADVANLSNIMTTLGLVGGSRKGSLYRHLATQPGSYSSRLNQTLRTSRVNPTIGELLQVLQTTDLLFGTGMQLGPVMGLPLDLLSLAVRGGTLNVPVEGLATLAALAPAFFSASPWAGLAGLAAGFAISAFPDLIPGQFSIPVPALLPTIPETASTVEGFPPYLDTLTALETADQVLTDMSYLDGLSQELSPTEHAMLELARFQALAVLIPVSLASPGGILQPESHPAIAAPPPIPRRPLVWLHESPTAPPAIAIASLLGQAWFSLAIGLEGPQAIDRPTWAPFVHDAARAVELGRPAR